MVNPSDASEIAPLLTSAATIVFAQKMLKQWQPYARFVQAFPGADRWAHWLVAGLGSLVASLGIHWAYTWSVAAGGTVTFTIPGFADLAHGFLDWFKIYILQHTVYESTHHPPYVPDANVPGVGLTAAEKQP